MKHVLLPLALLISTSCRTPLMAEMSAPPASASASADAKVRWIQDRFAIGFWEEPPVDDKMDQRYAEIAEANFTVVLGGHRATKLQQVMRQLDLCAKYDLKAIVWRVWSMNEVTRHPEKLPDHPACWGYHLKDEPGAKSFPEIGKAVAAMRRAQPGKLAYVNLFPGAPGLRNQLHPGGNSYLQTESYEEYVRRFVEEVDVDMLSMDSYPTITPNDDGRDAYCFNLAVMRKYSLIHDIPFWNYFNAIRFGHLSDPTEGQMRWQIYTSLAYGAKGVWYFIYWTGTYDGSLAKNPGQFMNTIGLIDLKGRRTRRYHQAKRINAAVKMLGPTLMKLTSTGVYRVKPSEHGYPVLGRAPVTSIGEWTVTKGTPRRVDLGDYLIGTFRHEDGREAVLINNYHYAHNAWPTVEFRDDLAQIREVCPETGREILVEDDSPHMEGLQLSIENGGGRLFLIDPS